MKTKSLITAMLLGSAALAAEAAPAGSESRLREHFDRMDANKDGVVSFEEMKAFHEKSRAEGHDRMHARLKEIDTDNDGRISRAEAANAPRLAEHFDEIDTNRDGFITREEMQAARQQRRGK